MAGQPYPVALFEFKALPVLAAFYIGKQFTSPKREQIGVWELLDGILLGSASAVGFTLVETTLFSMVLTR